ncbi:DUF2345 domain-containing protein, partial [Escherichia coli]|nr:DUF2345 domain-containing protein [Escherichia coli]
SFRQSCNSILRCPSISDGRLSYQFSSDGYIRRSVYAYKKSIEIVSTEDEIKITAKKKITINGGGSYIRIEGSGIEPGTPGDYNVKAVHYGRQPKASEKVPMPEFPILSAVDSSDFCLECLLNAIKNDDAVVEGV